MSLGAEMAAEADAYVSSMELNIQHGLWVQKDGTPIHVKDMSKTHIENTIAMLERNGGYFADEWIITFKAELAYRDYIRRVVNENW